jgi:hypothetical protein
VIEPLEPTGIPSGAGFDMTGMRELLISPAEQGLEADFPADLLVRRRPPGTSEQHGAHYHLKLCRIKPVHELHLASLADVVNFLQMMFVVARAAIASHCFRFLSLLFSLLTSLLKTFSFENASEEKRVKSKE